MDILEKCGRNPFLFEGSMQRRDIVEKLVLKKARGLHTLKQICFVCVIFELAKARTDIKPSVTLRLDSGCHDVCVTGSTQNLLKSIFKPLHVSVTDYVLRADGIHGDHWLGLIWEAFASISGMLGSFALCPALGRRGKPDLVISPYDDVDAVSVS